MKTLPEILSECIVILYTDVMRVYGRFSVQLQSSDPNTTLQYPTALCISGFSYTFHVYMQLS
jgi:hypothetical protein